MAVQARWHGMRWETSPNIIKALHGLTTSYKLKSTSDAKGGTNKVKGYELQPLTLEYDTAIVTGGNPRGELEAWMKLVGRIAPFYLAGRRFGARRFQLDSVALSSAELDSVGNMIFATISLSFSEHSAEGGKAVERMQIFYKGVDIYNDISVNECVHDMHAASRSDELLIRFNDTNHKWDGWSPGNEDDINVVDGVARTGKMFVESVKPENGMMALRAYSIPPTAKDKSTKSWENVRLLQLGEEIATRHGLSFESYEVTDQLYEYVRQDDTPDFLFLEQRCALEGVAFLVFDGTLVMYGEAALEAQAPAGTIEVTPDSNFEYNDDAANAYSKSEVVNGSITGTFSAESGSSKVFHKVLQVQMTTQAEGNRFAAGLLRYENKNTTTGTLSSAILRDYAAGSVATIKTAGAGSWDGPAFIYRLRHDYVTEKSKVFFRRPLEGY